MEQQHLNEDARRTLENLRAARAERLAREEAAVKEAKRTSGREPFDIEVLQRYYDPSLDIGARPIAAGDIKEYERKYYLQAPEEISTLERFADYLLFLHQNDAS
ncbi:hypothetical protein GCM10009550_54310 [Actinocorallia libanotica]|uniref:Uncharacterized protein n=1 Tax=Actinocorallia libanotica TaxID=46162 RepID=A0ABP4C7Z0_9ACTN